MTKLPLLNLRSCLSLTLALSCLLPAFAESGVSIYQKLSEYEQTLFGKEESGQPIEKRLQNVEKQLFGKAQKGASTAERLDEIDGVMAGKSGSKYLPPIAPSMDRSGFAPQPKQAPASPEVANNSSSREIEAPLPADSSDRIKGILRQAMENYSRGKTLEAERAFLQVLAIDYRNVDANYNLGAIAESKGDFDSARRYYTAALKGDPSDLELKDALAAVQDKIKKNQVARAPKTAPPPSAPSGNELSGAPSTAGDRAIASEAASAYKKGNFDDAIEKLTYLARKNPYDANTQFALGQAFRGKGKDSEAIKHLRSAATLDPKNDLYVKSLGDLQAQMDDKQMASSGGAGTSGKQDVTPFVGLPTADANGNIAGRVNGNDLAAVEDYLRRNSGSVMIGSDSRYGGFGGGLGASFGGGGFGFGGMPMGLGTAPGGTRLKRVMSSSLSGAAVGAMSNRNQPGGMSKGAMRGAMYGGLYGLLLGGY